MQQSMKMREHVKSRVGERRSPLWADRTIRLTLRTAGSLALVSVVTRTLPGQGPVKKHITSAS